MTTVFRVLALWLVCATLPAADRYILPVKPGESYPPPGTPNVWTGYPVRPGDPKTTFYQPRYPAVRVWFDPQLKVVTDKDGNPLYKWQRNALLNFSTVCGLIFQETDDYATAALRFHYRPRDVIAQLSWQWQRYGTGYWAIDPNGADYYFGDRLKPAKGGGKIGEVNATREVMRALMCGEFGYCDNTDSHWQPHGTGEAYAASNPNMGASIKYPWTAAGRARWGYAGFASWEIDALVRQFGYPWLYRFDAGYGAAAPDEAEEPSPVFEGVPKGTEWFRPPGIDRPRPVPTFGRPIR